MTGWALTLILAAAVTHATWNFFNKQRERACHVYLAGGGALGAALRAGDDHGHRSLAIEVNFVVIGLMAGSAALHTAYFVLLNQGYRVGDLSLVYPLARGTGPLLSTIAAILFLGERPSLIALAGALLIIGGAVMLTGKPVAVAPNRRARCDALCFGHRLVYRRIHLVGQAGGESLRHRPHWYWTGAPMSGEPFS